MRTKVVPPEMQAAALKHCGYSMAHRVITTQWLHIHKKLQFVINPYIWPLKYTRANKSPNLFLQKWKKRHLDKLKEVKTPWVLDGSSSSSYHLKYPWWLHITQSHKKLQFVINPWSLTFKISLHQQEPKLISTEMQATALRLTKEVKTPWVLDGTSNSGHSMIAYHTES